ncbi:MAG TPA: iron-sulfur cluster assembly scaffold protein [Syntrophorhabdus sp.]|nr:iron-sulfur cluster assembly scaffold protein [Syntrophorhabdus sp.]
MSGKLDDFLTNLQNEIFDDTIKTYGETAYERWRNPLYMKSIHNPDGYARVTGPCGDTMEIFLKFNGGRVSDASFQTDGCGPSQICGSFAAELAFGKNIDELKEITNQTILNIVGGLPEENQHCALLAANTLHDAVDNYLKKRLS